MLAIVLYQKLCAWLFCVTLCDSMDCSPPGSSVHEISQARIWSGLPFPTLGDLHHPGTEPTSPAAPALASRFFITGKPGNAMYKLQRYINDVLTLEELSRGSGLVNEYIHLMGYVSHLHGRGPSEVYQIQQIRGKWGEATRKASLR